MGGVPSQSPWNFAAPGTTGGPQQTIPGGAPAYNPGASGWAPDFNYAAPGTTGGPQQTIGPGGQQLDIWSRLMNAVGQGNLPKMPGTTFGAPAGAAGSTGAPLPPPPMLPQTQMPRPPGIPGMPGIPALQQPGGAGGGNNALLAQYMALQQLMRGS
jgi:hypothetical protein